MTAGPLTILVWNEGRHERTPEIAAVYPTGIHGAIRDGLAAHLPPDTAIRTAILDDADQGLSEAALADVDVLFWWGHLAHGAVEDDAVERVRNRVLGGMGLVVLHSGHYSKIFIRLMGTTCALNWRNDGDRELVWTVAPTHPIALGVPSPIVIDRQEMYGEHFDVPDPDELVFISSFAGGEVFRAGLAYTRGRGRIFYFSPGDQDYPVYHHADIRRVLANAALWARPPEPAREPARAEHAPRRFR